MSGLFGLNPIGRARRGRVQVPDRRPEGVHQRLVQVENQNELSLLQVLLARFLPAGQVG
jgi:hypothetical protein